MSAANSPKTNEPKVEKTPPTNEEIFDSTLKLVAARARDIAKAVKAYKDEETDIEELTLEVQLGQRKLSKALASMAQAYKAVSGK